MRERPAGDVDYERSGGQYSSMRQSEPRFAESIRQALGDAASVINVGAGAGSYEPTDREVTAVEPSASMRRQRPSTRGHAIDAVAEDLPFPDDCFDAGMATITIHQWRDLARGLAELQRVTRGPVVIMTFDPDALRRFWLAKYAPRLMDHEAGRMPAISRVEHLLGGSNECVSLPIPENCSDGFAEAYFGRPEAFFDEAVRGAQSAWSFLEADEITSALHALRADLDSGAWDRSYGHLREAPEYDGALRLIIHRRTSPRR